MFGDQNNNGHQDGNGAPMPDGGASAMPPQNNQPGPPPPPNPPVGVMPPNDNPAGNYMMDVEPAATAPAVVTPTTSNADDLLDIKRHALQQLTPLLSHLDQKPSAKFRTTMMMIQASDDSSLIQQAYQAALAVEDDKERAQDLLDVVNEINYFTQNQTDATA
jgi:hypothetical protein